MRKSGSKKWIFMFGGWACSLVLLVFLMCSSLSKYISGQLAESGAGVAVMNCSFTASVQDVVLVNDESGVSVPSACTIAYTVKNYSDVGVCEVAVRPHFRIYAAAEFLESMVFQMAEITAEKVEAITPPYYMASLSKAGTFSTDGYTSGTDAEGTDTSTADIGVGNALNALKKLNYADNTAAETVTVTANGDNYYSAKCTVKDDDGNETQTAAITVTNTTQEQGYTPFFSRGEALTLTTDGTEGGTDGTGSVSSTANDMSASPLYVETTAEGAYMCLDIELYGVSLPAGEKSEKTYACYFAPAAKIQNNNILGKSYGQIEGNVTGWYYDAKIQPTNTADDGSALSPVTVRVRGEITETATESGTAETTYYVLDGDTENELTISDDGDYYIYGNYTFLAADLEKYADYAYNPDGSDDEKYILGTAFGVIYPLQVKMLFEQTQGV